MILSMNRQKLSFDLGLCHLCHMSPSELYVRKSDHMHFCLFTHFKNIWSGSDMSRKKQKNIYFLFLCKCSQCKLLLSHHQRLLLLVLPEMASSHWTWMKFGCCESLSLWATLRDRDKNHDTFMSDSGDREPERGLQVAVSILLEHE